uniref:Uncharacterized protein n=1 Tax=Siphoviridae sp. ctBLh2 TaxID=2827803 RepID=A0A8S5S3X7_9CAUD|nr:MAG TPA: hypothetical protein [Siphoviridae sp. ctBLh2]
MAHAAGCRGGRKAGQGRRTAVTPRRRNRKTNKNPIS